MNSLLERIRQLPQHLNSAIQKWHRKRKILSLVRSARPLRNDAETVLFWVPGGWQLNLHVEGAIALSLRLRGVNVHAVICDGPFRACVQREIVDGVSVKDWEKRCRSCREENSTTLRSLGIPYSFIGDYVSEVSRQVLWEKASLVKWDTLKELNYRDINVGVNVCAAIIRYLKGFELSGHEDIVREYAFSGLVATEAAANAIERISPSRLFMSHGLYIDWGPALLTALSHGLPVSIWGTSHLKAHLYFTHIRKATQRGRHMRKEDWEKYRQVPLTDTQRHRLDAYIENRYIKHVTFDIKKPRKYIGNAEILRNKYDLANDRPIWGIMTHMNWDAVSEHSPMAYENFDSWLIDTVNIISDVKDIQWVIKIHPVELIHNPESGAKRLIDSNFPSLPPHIKVISYKEDISSFDFFNLIDGGVTVYGTSGLELSLLGKPVILAGEAHYGGRGFTYDGPDMTSYRKLLRKASSIGALSSEQVDMAKRYAYAHFIRKQIPLDVVNDPKSKWWYFQCSKRHLLLPGKDPFIDFICDRIMDGKDFIMDEHLVKLALKEK